MSEDSVPPRTASHSPSSDELFEVLSHAHRRFALYTLREFGPMRFDDLVDVVTGWLYTWDGGTALPADRQRVATALHHVHVPKLVDTAVVIRDDDTGSLSFAITDPHIDELLDCCQANERQVAPIDEHVRG